jgi:hypothetical protein
LENFAKTNGCLFIAVTLCLFIYKECNKIHYSLDILKLHPFQSHSLQQGSPHRVKTGRLDFSLSWHKGEVRENLGDFRKSIQILTFLSPLLHVPLPFTKRTCCTIILKKDAINELGIKYWTSNPVWVKFQEHGIYWRKSMIIG